MLTSLEIQHFRTCRSTNLVFTGGVIALVGRNGAGKTNILRGIEWLAGVARDPFQSRLKHRWKRNRVTPLFACATLNFDNFENR